MEANAVREALLRLKRGAVIIRRARVRLDEQIADLRIRAPSENRFAGGQHAVLKRVEVSRVPRHLPGAEEEIPGRQRNPAASLLRDLNARLVAVWRPDRAVERIGEPETARGRH